MIAIQVDRVQAQLGVKFAQESHVAARFEPPDPGRITGDIRLGEHQQRGARTGGLVDRFHRPSERPATIEQHWRSLNYGDFHRHGRMSFVGQKSRFPVTNARSMVLSIMSSPKRFEGPSSNRGIEAKLPSCR